MEQKVHDIREGWTDKEWNEYYQFMAEVDAEKELDDEQYEEIVEQELGL